MYLITHNRFGQALGQDFLAQSGSISDEERFRQSLDTIRRELRLRLRADDASGIYVRRARLREAFNAVPASRAQALYNRLQRSDDALGQFFRYRLATATRNEMLEILRRKFSTPSSSPQTCSHSITNALTIELEAARRTLARNRALASELYFGGTYRFFFAKLYETTTTKEILEAERNPGQFVHPAFALHFIPIFFDMYDQAYQHYRNRDFGRVSPLWMNHFTVTQYPQHYQLDLWMIGVRESVVTGARAHIQGDMALALERAYRSYTAKYCLHNISFSMLSVRIFLNGICRSFTPSNANS